MGDQCSGRRATPPLGGDAAHGSDQVREIPRVVGVTEGRNRRTRGSTGDSDGDETDSRERTGRPASARDAKIASSTPHSAPSRHRPAVPSSSSAGMSVAIASSSMAGMSADPAIVAEMGTAGVPSRPSWADDAQMPSSRSAAAPSASTSRRTEPHSRPFSGERGPVGFTCSRVVAVAERTVPRRSRKLVGWGRGTGESAIGRTGLLSAVGDAHGAGRDTRCRRRGRRRRVRRRIGRVRGRERCPRGTSGA